MTSLPFPDTGTRYVELPNGKPGINQIGYLYQDVNLTVVAEAYADVGGVKGDLLPVDELGRRYLRTDGYGRQVNYWGPASGQDRLWIVVNGVVNPVDADYNARLDALGARVVDLESGLAAADALLTPVTRTISTTAPLTGGGDLSANRTLAVSSATTGAVGVVQLAGDLAGTATAPTIATGAVTSAKIADGTIVDADISESAAINASKIGTDSRYDTAGAAAAMALVFGG